ncbi:MAG: MFS transporter, partial [Caulobacteraceae bacterium]
MAIADRRVGVTLALCFMTALMEGMDLQSMGVAAPLMAPEFGLDKQQLGVILSASPFGLLLGAILGGRLADVFGRKAMLVATMTIFGIFTLITALVEGVEVLTVVRFLTGVGLGGALPNLLALASEAVGGDGKVGKVVISFAGMPIGGALISLIAAVAATQHEWRIIFYVGGIAPLALAAVMMLALPESRGFQEAKAAAAAGTVTKIDSFKALFGDGRTFATLCLWVCCLCLNLVSYLLLNWLPSLNISKGFTPTQASTLQTAFNFTSCFGAIALGRLMDARPGKLVLGGCLVGLALSFVALAATGSDFLLTALILTFTGAFLYGGIYIVYGLIPGFYPTLVRGVGAGACFAAGRVGSIAGPLLAAGILGAGRGATDVLQALLPITVL